MASMSDPRKVYDALDAMGIQYEKYEHPPVFTGEEAAESAFGHVNKFS